MTNVCDTSLEVDTPLEVNTSTMRMNKIRECRLRYFEKKGSTYSDKEGEKKSRVEREIFVHDVKDEKLCEKQDTKKLCVKQDTSPCPVCFENTTTICCPNQHFVHKACIISSGKPTCPVCRSSLLDTFLTDDERKRMSSIETKFKNQESEDEFVRLVQEEWNNEERQKRYLENVSAQMAFLYSE